MRPWRRGGTSPIGRNVTPAVEPRACTRPTLPGRSTNRPWEVVMARFADRVTGWWLFAGILLVIGGTLEIILGIAAVGDAKVFFAKQKDIISGPHTWGWVPLILRVGEILAGVSLSPRGGFGPR